MIESAFFYESLKSVAAKINSIAKEMDKKTNDFAEAVIAVFVDYDEEIFTRNGNEGDRADIKQSIINLFSTFAPEKKDKKLTGYNLYCQEARADLVERNPNIKAADVMAALGAEWKALDESEKKEWNTKAAEKSPATEEEKAAKKSKSKKSSAPKKTCDYAGCTKVVKDPSQHSDGCVYCASCLKKVVVAEKKATTPKCQHLDKEGEQCKANAINGEWCSKHMKKSSPSVKPVAEPKKVEKEEKKVNKSESKKPEKKSESKKSEKKESIKDELKSKVSAVEKKIEEAKKKASSPAAKPVAKPVAKKSGFDFSTEEPVDKDDEKFWEFKNAKAGKEEIRINKRTGLVFKRHSDELFGLNKDGEMIDLENVDEEVKEWARRCGWGKEEDDEIEMDDDLDVDADQLESDEE